jgi:tetratricopeptide (TPR) repeat protein
MREEPTDMGSADGSRTTRTERGTPADLLGEGKGHQLGGRLQEAAECFAQAIDVAAALDEGAPMAEGLRRLGIVHHLQGETATGIHFCQRSRDLATGLGNSVLAAEATMALANMACSQGRIDEAREYYRAALALSPGHPDLAARIEQNLGIVESVQGNLAAALEHYRRALQAHESTHNVLGCARAHHNIGMICADRKEWDAAHRAYEHAAALARQGGDYHLQGLCLLNHAEIELEHKRYEEVRRRAEAALAIFNRLGARVEMADAFRMLGTALRFLKRPTLAESRLRSALEIAANAGVPLTEAESCRDIAFLFAETGRSGEALGFMDRALVLFKQLGATLDAAALSERRTELLAA